MAVKLTDVAKKAGVSSTTVSRVINNYGSLSEKTIEKVKKAMLELNYIPNQAARALQGKSIRLIGLLVPSIQHPFFSELVRYLEDDLFKNGFKVILCNCYENIEKEKDYLKMLEANQVDGIITCTPNYKKILAYQSIKLPIVSFGRFLSNDIPTVKVDDFSGAKMATQHLIEQGCQNIGFINPKNDAIFQLSHKKEGYLSALAEKNLKPHYFEYHSNFYFSNDDQTIIKSILQNKQLDGVFCTNDLIALLCNDLSAQMGREVPSDFKIIGYDGTQVIRKFLPSLSTIVQPLDKIANNLIYLLFEMLPNQPEHPTITELKDLNLYLHQGRSTKKRLEKSI